MILLSADDCRVVLDPGAVLEAIEDALGMEHAGTVRSSVPASLRVPGGEGRGRLRVKACTLEGPAVTGVRILNFPVAGDATRWVLLFRETTGEPLAIVDEAWTYTHRSIASVALVADRLRPAAVRSVALVGAGRIARAALAYVARLFPGAPLGIASRRAPTRTALADLARTGYGIDARPTSVEDAVRVAQIVLACTSATEPVVLEGWVSPGAVVASLEPRECDPALFARADLRVVDAREQLREELAAAFGPDAPGRVDATFADVVAGGRASRTREDDRVLVLSQGLVSQDVLLAFRAWRAAERRGIGTSVPDRAYG